jgi:hypothetical protein
MAKRIENIAVCSCCIESFPRKEMYIVTRKMHRGHPEDDGVYTTPYCKTCLSETETYLQVVEEPKPVKKKVSKASETKTKKGI